MQEYVVHMPASGAAPHAEIVGLPHVSLVHLRTYTYAHTHMQEYVVHMPACGAAPHAEDVGLPHVPLVLCIWDGKLIPHGEP